MQSLYSLYGIRNIFKSKGFHLAFTWTLGLIAGYYVLDQTPLISLMRSSHFLRMSIVDLILSLAIPFLVSFILLRYFSFYSVLPFVFLKALSYFLCYGGITLIFGNAGWLLSGMLLFSDSIFVIMLLLIWFNAAIGKKPNLRRCIAAYIISSIAIVYLDYFVVSPYVAMLLNY